MISALHHGDIVLVGLARRAPTCPASSCFTTVWRCGAGRRRLDHVPNTDPPRVRIISDNPLYAPYEGMAEEVNIIWPDPVVCHGDLMPGHRLSSQPRAHLAAQHPQGDPCWRRDR